MTGMTVETVVTGEIIIMSVVVYYNRVMDNILSLMAVVPCRGCDGCKYIIIYI